MIHEFGHFIFAKMLGVRVNEYSIGFGPALFSWQGKETKYSLRLVPFGGYCAMEGESEESTDSRAFCNKKAWRRFLIIIAGALFNILLGFLLVFFSLLPADRFGTTTVDIFRDDPGIEVVSKDYGLREGDTILRVDGRRIYTTYDLSYAFSNVQNGTVSMMVERDGKKVDLDAVKFNTVEEDGISYIQVDFYIVGVKNTPMTLIAQSAKQTLSYARIVWFSLVDLITGKFGISQMSGPVGVTAAIGTAVRTGLDSLLPLLALITINLGIFNLLPIPALDGSRALFILIEMITRRPVPSKYENIIHAVGLILLLLLIALITVKDIISFF